MIQFKTKYWLIAVLVAVPVILSGGCAKEYQAKEEALEKPINCATAEGDIRVLESEKTHATDQLAAGVQSIIPVSLIGGVATGTADTKAEIATGEYNDLIDKKIEEIKEACGIQ